jgi:hypothetical protein
MFMNPIRFSVVTLLFGFCTASAFAWGDNVPLCHSTDALAARDEWGLFCQGPVNSTDFEPRANRSSYYTRPGSSLIQDPAYVGALQDCLRRKGYYVGPIDGVYSAWVSDAIARLQKAYAMHVTGTLTIPVRRALYLP